jgi:hypothetical protein
MITVDFIKKSLRVSSSAFDDELSALMSEAVEDLARSGIIDTESEMFNRAVVCYCRTYFGDKEEKERELLRKGYEVIKQRLAATDFEVT